MQHPVTAPPIPERIRTLAAAAVPTHVSFAGTARPAVPARGGVDGAGRPVLLVRAGDPLYGARDEPAVTVDLAASRSLGGLEATRGLLKVQGWVQAVPAAEAREAAVAIAGHCPDEALFDALEELAASGGGGRPEGAGSPLLLRVDVGQVIYLTGGESGVVDAEDYLRAAPDPLAEQAERMLAHVNDTHRQQLTDALCSLLGAPVREVWLWELDRYGATVRHGADRPALVRLPWPAPAACARSLEQAVHDLLCHR
ncbi:DUF2470 domain-containing protein [Streptosporangium sp. NPDC048047]|uniref:DUF2470 domain-containing protein n=1 Tax=Streptosporangium sp. NPDC048047 TaxID=3155748 RepID=UPI0034209EEB